MSTQISYTPPSLLQIPEMVTVGRRAFANDGLELAIVPDRSEAFQGSKEAISFRENRIRKRLVSADWVYLLAISKESEGTEEEEEEGGKILGYAGWKVPRGSKMWGSGRDVEKQGEEGEKEEDKIPEGVNMEAFNYVGEVLEDAKKEVLGEEGEDSVWYLASLAIDPSHSGKGIASTLVRWGLTKAAEDGVPMYLESSPAAVGLYRKLGFRELKRCHVVKGKGDGDEGDHVLTVMIKKDGE